MQLPVVIEPLPDGSGFTARLAAPLQSDWLPNDELTRSWQQEIRAYRAECDRNDCAPIDVNEVREK